MKKRGVKDPKQLSKPDKYKLLTKNHLLSSTAGPLDHDGRKFKAESVIKHGDSAGHIHYSVSGDRCFCLACALFGVFKSQSVQTKWTNTGYNDWKRMNDNKKGLSVHLKSESHISAHLASDAFIETMKDGVRAVKVMTDKNTAKKIEENSKILSGVINAVKLCGRQGISLRGHRETEDLSFPDRNKGNFLSILETLAIYDKTLAKLMEDVKRRQLSGSKVQASMTSKRVQNELINIMGTSILNSIVEDVKEAGKFILISDETTLHNTPYLTIGIRYVHKGKKQVVEEFITFQELKCGKAESIFEQLLEGLKEANLPIGLLLLYINVHFSQVHTISFLNLQGLYKPDFKAIEHF